MENVVTQMTTTLSPTAIWGVYGSLFPFIGSMVLVALGFYLIRRQLKKTSKARA